MTSIDHPAHRPTTVMLHSRLGGINLSAVRTQAATLADLNGDQIADNALAWAIDRVRLHHEHQSDEPAPHWTLGLSDQVTWVLDHVGRNGDILLDGGQLTLAELIAVVQRGNIGVTLGTDQHDLVNVALRTISGQIDFCSTADTPRLQELIFDVAAGKLKTELTGNYPTLQMMTTHLLSASGQLKLSGQFGAALRGNIQVENGDLSVAIDGQFEDTQLSIQSKSSHLSVQLNSDILTAIDINAAASTYRADGLHWYDGYWWTDPSPTNTPQLLIAINAQSGAVDINARQSR